MSEAAGGRGARMRSKVSALPGNRRLALVAALLIALVALIAGLALGGGDGERGRVGPAGAGDAWS